MSDDRHPEDLGLAMILAGAEAIFADTRSYMFLRDNRGRTGILILGWQPETAGQIPDWIRQVVVATGTTTPPADPPTN